MIWVWPGKGDVFSTLCGHEKPVERLAASDDGWLFSSSTESSILVWDAVKGVLVGTIATEAPAISIAADVGGLVYAGFDDFVIEAWDASEGTHAVTIPRRDISRCNLGLVRASPD